jgi:hypothetical protein
LQDEEVLIFFTGSSDDNPSTTTKILQKNNQVVDLLENSDAVIYKALLYTYEALAQYKIAGDGARIFKL